MVDGLIVVREKRLSNQNCQMQMTLSCPCCRLLREGTRQAALEQCGVSHRPL